MDLAGRLDGAVHHLGLRVYYEDTDAGGIVYHANYLKFCERGRSDFLRLLGVDQGAMLQAEPPFMFVVRRCEIDYLKPARLDDELDVVTKIVDLSRVTLTMEQTVWRGSEKLAALKVLVAAIGKAGRPARFPADIRHIFNTLLCSDAATLGHLVAEGKDHK